MHTIDFGCTHDVNVLNICFSSAFVITNTTDNQLHGLNMVFLDSALMCQNNRNLFEKINFNPKNALIFASLSVLNLTIFVCLKRKSFNIYHGNQVTILFVFNSDLFAYVHHIENIYSVEGVVINKNMIE